MVSSGLRLVAGDRKPGFHYPPAYRGRASGQWEPAAGRLPSAGTAVMAQVVPAMWTRDLGCPVVHGHQASHQLCGVDGLSRAVPAGSCCAGLPLRGTSAIFSPVNLSPCLGRKD